MRKWMAEISLCMIVRDEEETLGRCLESVKVAVDEIIIYIMPCIIGTGDHFFKSGLFPTDWTLAENRKYGGGIIRLTYRRNRKRR